MIAIIIALAFVAGALLIAGALRPRVTLVRGRIDSYVASPEPVALHPWLQQGFGDRAVRPVLVGIGRLFRLVTPAGVLDKVRRKLDMAGNPRYVGVQEYAGLKVLSVVVIIGGGLYALRALQFDGVLLWLALPVVLALGFWLPDIVLQRIIESRQAAIRRALPDVLDMIVISVEAGVGFDGAVQKVVEKGQGPLRDELARALEQIRLGKTRADALREMGDRTQVDDLVSFVAAVQQAENLGVSIAKVLRVQADAARERRSQRAREAAAKLPVKLLFPLVFFIFPSLFVVILGPGAIRFADLFKVMGR